MNEGAACCDAEKEAQYLTIMLSKNLYSIFPELKFSSQFSEFKILKDSVYINLLIEKKSRELYVNTKHVSHEVFCFQEVLDEIQALFCLNLFWEQEIKC